jgi:hypothetical protein
MQYDLKKIVIRYSGLRNTIELTNTLGLEYIDIVQRSLRKENPEDAPFLIFTPSVKDFRQGLMNKDECLNEIDKLLFNTIEDSEERNWGDILSWLDQTQKFRVFQNFESTMSNVEYWKGLRECYLGSDFAHLHSDTIAYYLFSSRGEKHNLMTAEEFNHLNNLPSQVTIYRGCSLSEIESGDYRFSWSLDKSVAEFFANKYFRNTGLKGGVTRLTVPKSKIRAYLDGRNEQEVIYKRNLIEAG